MRIFNFAVLSVITALHNVPTLHISKTHLPIVLFNVHEIKLNGCSKTSQGKREIPLCGVGNPTPPPPKALRLNGAPSLHRGMRLLNAVRSK